MVYGSHIMSYMFKKYNILKYYRFKNIFPNYPQYPGFLT